MALYVFEGPDGVGKTTLVKELADRLRGGNISTSRLAFPGNEPGTLGHLVYRLHHNPESLNISFTQDLATQILHVSAHVEAIDERIKPALEKTDVVLLDRYWWSTWVYGRAAGISKSQLAKLISVEREVWSSITPSMLFLITKGPASPADDKNDLVGLYRNLSEVEQDKYDIVDIRNTGSVSTTVDTVLKHIAPDIVR